MSPSPVTVDLCVRFLRMSQVLAPVLWTSAGFKTPSSHPIHPPRTEDPCPDPAVLPAGYVKTTGAVSAWDMGPGHSGWTWSVNMQAH